MIRILATKMFLRTLGKKVGWLFVGEIVRQGTRASVRMVIKSMHKNSHRKKRKRRKGFGPAPKVVERKKTK